MIMSRDEQGELIEDPSGRPFRQWRDEIRSPNDIWQKITEAADIPGTTSAPKLQPIAARIVMLQSGMRAPMGMKIKGPDLETIERVALQIEGLLKQVPTVQASAVIADRIVGKPYLEIDIDRDAIKRYGLHIRSVQDVIEVAIGGRRITTTVEGRERYPVRVRYARELRDELETLGRILVPTPMGQQIPLEQLAQIKYVRGPQVIKSEDTFLLGYVLFDMKPGNAEVDVVEDAQAFLQEKIDSGEFVLPAGVSYTFAGNYENQIRSQKTLMIVLPLALGIIFLILYFQFKSVITTSLVFSGIMIAWSGGFIMLWLYGTDWFLNFDLFGTNMRTLFQVHTINLSVAVWVGFLALFGIASDDGVVIASYLDESFRKDRIANAEHAREATVTAGMRRVRPVPDDDRNDAACPDSGAHIDGTRQRHHGADGDPQFRRHDDRNHDDARRAGALLHGHGMEAKAGNQRPTIRRRRVARVRYGDQQIRRSPCLDFAVIAGLTTVTLFDALGR